VTSVEVLSPHAVDDPRQARRHYDAAHLQQLQQERRERSSRRPTSRPELRFGAVPPDVVIMNTEIVYEGVDTGVRRTVRVVYPREEQGPGTLPAEA